MADRVLPGPVGNSARINEAVCIQTRKIMDSCLDKDCIEDLRVFPYESSAAALESAYGVRPRSARILDIDVVTEEIAFNRGYYTIDVTFLFEVTGELVTTGAPVGGVAIFSKRCMLFGGEGSAAIYTSNAGAMTNSPVAAVEVVDPMILAMRLADTLQEDCGEAEAEIPAFSDAIRASLPESVQFGDSSRRWYTTLGQFSIIRLERDTQLVIPMYDYCVPTKECVGADEDDPCTLFSRIDFPINEFYPPDLQAAAESAVADDE